MLEYLYNFLTHQKCDRQSKDYFWHAPEMLRGAYQRGYTNPNIFWVLQRVNAVYANPLP